MLCQALSRMAKDFAKYKPILAQVLVKEANKKNPDDESNFS